METITVTQYKSYDGKIFSSKKGCQTYEKDKVKLDKIEKIIGKQYKDETCSFANGEGYIQHDIETLKKCWIQFLKFCKTKYKKDEYIIKNIEHSIKNPHLGPYYSMLGRYIDGHYCYYLLYRLMCIDFKTGREYGQPYFAINPDKATSCEIKIKV